VQLPTVGNYVFTLFVLMSVSLSWCPSWCL